MGSSTEKAFWRRFVDTIWERTPAHLGSTIEPLLRADEVFSLAVTVGQSLASGNTSLRIRWCDDGKHVVWLQPNAKSASRLPQGSDRDLSGYVARMSRHETFFFQVPALHLHHPALWPRLAAFTENFYPHVGTPGQMAWTDVYFGRYQATPFGVHLDGASNFTFGIAGDKTLYLWEPEYYRAHMAGASPHDYERFRHAAMKLTVGPGEVIYWPARYHHIAVPDGRFSVTMNFAFYPERSQSAWLERAFGQLITQEKRRMQGPLHGSSLPDDLAQTCRAAASRAAQGGLERELLRGVVEHSTRLGFEHPPPQRPPERLEPNDRVRLAPQCKLVSAPDGHDAVVVSANGYSFVAEKADPIHAALRRLRSGQLLRVELDTRVLLEQLHRWGAVDRAGTFGDSVQHAGAKRARRRGRR